MIHIRRATVADCPDLSEIFLAARRQAFTWCDPASFHAGDFMDQTIGEAIYLAHDAESRTLGFISIWEQDRFVHHLYVAPEHQGRGVGTHLLHSLHTWLPFPYRLKCLLANTAARALYDKCGWREIEIGSDPLGDYVLMEITGIPSR